ncbi:calphotin [Helicoverpa armigera]|uniref:calphotin n=1 Tax=Helicoverpa armigera TaxID=29058 RepID=UPI003082977B
MKFFIAFAALVALAVASPVTKPVNAELAQLEAIIAAINSPNTDPATAALLEQQLFDIISAVNPIEVGPVIIPEPVIKPEPVDISPVIVAPQPDGGAVSNPIVPSPVVIGEIPAGAPAPLVQIIVNIKNANTPVGPAIVPTPVDVVDVVDVPVEPVDVVEVAPVPVEPVIVETPIIPEGAVILPEELN